MNLVLNVPILIGWSLTLPLKVFVRDPIADRSCGVGQMLYREPDVSVGDPKSGEEHGDVLLLRRSKLSR